MLIFYDLPRKKYRKLVDEINFHKISMIPEVMAQARNSYFSIISNHWLLN